MLELLVGFMREISGRAVLEELHRYTAHKNWRVPLLGMRRGRRTNSACSIAPTFFSDCRQGSKAGNVDDLTGLLVAVDSSG